MEKSDRTIARRRSYSRDGNFENAVNLLDLRELVCGSRVFQQKIERRDQRPAARTESRKPNLRDRDNYPKRMRRLSASRSGAPSPARRAQVEGSGTAAAPVATIRSVCSVAGPPGKLEKSLTEN